jgi:hypothetical protein
MLLNKEQSLYSVLRIATAMCFIGHGAFGIITKPVWCNYFGVFGIGHNMAYHIMPLLGTADILMGIIMLVYPIRIVAFWLVLWGLVTATLRPLSGEPFAELIERAGNFGTPIALLLLVGTNGKTVKYWFTKINPFCQPDDLTLTAVIFCLRIVVFFLFVGHGWLNLIEKKGLLTQYVSLGFSNPVSIAHIIGIFEIAAAFSVLLRPKPAILLFFLIWKVTSELFYPHWGIFEWIERGGSYGAILGLWLALKAETGVNSNSLSEYNDVNHLKESTA